MACAFGASAPGAGPGAVASDEAADPISAMTALPQGNQYAGAFSVYFAWGGVVGGVSDTTHEMKTFRIPAAEMEKARSGHLTYQVELNADQHTDRVALGVVDDVSKDFALRLIELRR